MYAPLNELTILVFSKKQNKKHELIFKVKNISVEENKAKQKKRQ
jgi:hypothetical protein